MTLAKLLLLGGMVIALMALQVLPLAAQQFPGFSKRLNDYKLSEKATVIVYRDTRGKKRVGVTRGKKLTALKVKFSSSTEFSNFTMIGDSLFFIAEDKAWSVKYFWPLDSGRLRFVATNAARKKTVTSKGLRKTSLAYVFLGNPSAKEWWVTKRKRDGNEISVEELRFFYFDSGGVVVDRRTVLVGHEVQTIRIPLKSPEDSQVFLYRLGGGRWKAKKLELKGLPRAGPDLNGDGINEVVMVQTQNYRNKSRENSELIWWDKKAKKFFNSGIEAEAQFGFNPGDDEGQEFEESTFQYNLKAKPFPLIVVKVERKMYDKEEEKINLGSFERRYQWNPAKRAFVQIGGKKPN